VEHAFAYVGRPILWRGKGLNEVGYEPKTGRELVKVDANYFRPTEVEQLLGDASKARERLGWTPKTKFQELVAEMVASDLGVAAREAGQKDRMAS
jgi:GDPmannose 4,6-dehydratase